MSVRAEIGTLLIANRGEIAVRIIATARAMGIRTIAIYSDADAQALHVRLADAAYRIGPAPARESYLDIAAVVRAARESGADAVHPGYGFLSENASFARAVTDAGLIFVGPDAETIERMSDKVTARAAAVAAGLPVLPGTGGTTASLEDARTAAPAIGYPLAVKACFGGGGRGMRVVEDASGLDAAFGSAVREAEAAFERGEVFLERFLPRPRHVEVQIIADRHGNVVHLGDRDCTVQRRHQKLIEEAPAPDLPERLRAEMRDCAVALCRAEHYVGAGTVEFLLDRAAGAFYFLEMNTRLQVEHGVSEMVTGLDLVETQILVAAGAPLPFAQDEVLTAGHAIEARIAAEDAWDGFRPSPGRVSRLSLPLAPWIRVDMGLEADDAVEPFYDSMFGKLLAWGPSRETARTRLTAALKRLRVEGVPTTAPYLAAVLDQPNFAAAAHFTGSVEQDWPPDPANRPKAAAPADREKPMESPTVSASMSASLSERLVGLPQRVAVFGVTAPAAPVAVASPREARRGGEDQTRTEAELSKIVISPMDATVVQTAVSAGDPVGAGDTLVMLEAMKMEVLIPAPSAGTIRRVLCAAGAPIRKGDVLVEFD